MRLRTVSGPLRTLRRNLILAKDYRRGTTCEVWYSISYRSRWDPSLKHGTWRLRIRADFDRRSNTCHLDRIWRLWGDPTNTVGIVYRSVWTTDISTSCIDVSLYFPMNLQSLALESIWSMTHALNAMYNLRSICYKLNIPCPLILVAQGTLGNNHVFHITGNLAWRKKCTNLEISRQESAISAWNSRWRKTCGETVAQGFMTSWRPLL